MKKQANDELENLANTSRLTEDDAKRLAEKVNAGMAKHAEKLVAELLLEKK